MFVYFVFFFFYSRDDVYSVLLTYISFLLTRFTYEIYIHYAVGSFAIGSYNYALVIIGMALDKHTIFFFISMLRSVFDRSDYDAHNVDHTH